MRRQRRVLGKSLVAVVVTAGAAVPALQSVGASSTEPAPSAATAGPGCEDMPDKVVFGAGGLFTFSSNAAFLIAQGQGFLDDAAEQFCTEFEYTEVGSGPDGVAALVGGAIDLCICSSIASAIAATQGQDIVAVTQLMEGTTLAMVGRVELEEERGTDLAAYADDRWGIGQEASSTAIYSQEAAIAAGLDWSAIDAITYPDVPSAIAALESGRLDIAALDANSVAKAVGDGVGYVVFNDNPKYNAQPIVVPQSLVDEHPDFVQAVVDAIRKGFNLLHENLGDPTAIRELFIPQYQEELDGIFEAAYPYSQQVYNGDGGFDPEITQASIDYLVRNGFITEDETDAALAFYDNQFAAASSIAVERLNG